MKVRVATTEDLLSMAEKELEVIKAELKDVKNKMYDVEGEMIKYRTAFQMLVKELSDRKK